MRHFSNEVGRYKGFFLGCCPPQGTPVRWILRASIVGVRVFTLTRCIASVLPTKHLFGHSGTHGKSKTLLTGPAFSWKDLTRASTL
jgi:hypothetical protein